MKAAIYIRVSTVMQIDKVGRTVQKEDLIRFCTDVLNISDYEIFEDAGFSGANTKRPDYQNMMHRMRTGEFTHLLVWKIDRISRNIVDFSDMYQELKSMNVTFVSYIEQFDTSTAVGQALLKIILIFSELERNNASERSKDVLLSKAKAGEYTGSRIPFGYRRIPETNEYSIAENEASLVKKLFDMFEQGATGYSIAKHLNGLPLDDRIKKNWTSTTIHSMLRNVCYIGTLKYNVRSYNSKKQAVPNRKEDWVLIANHHPAIVSEKQFEHCQELLDEHVRTHRHNRKPLFADLVFCSVTYLPLTWIKEDDRIFSSPAIYQCPHCHDSQFSDEDLGSFVFNYILNLLKTLSSAAASTAPNAIKQMIMRGKPSQFIDDIVNIVDIKHALFNDRDPAAERHDTEKILRYQIQQTQRELERLSSSGKESSGKKEELKLSLSKLSLELKQLKRNTVTPHILQTDFLKKCYDFYLKHNLYHLSDIDFAECTKNIAFYDLKHFFQKVLSCIWIADGKIQALEFSTNCSGLRRHNFI